MVRAVGCLDETMSGGKGKESQDRECKGALDILAIHVDPITVQRVKNEAAEKEKEKRVELGWGGWMPQSQRKGRCRVPGRPPWATLRGKVFKFTRKTCPLRPCFYLLG
ncbi:hypothetical protein KQX54_008243 [Cotesia glomerata]|uniref:Uncharacterized protein n=1 Tax=Cotesia glomerata TaxID=32391 RepID=A0AAV7J3R7_COTGL|nr:hypothetical protein KQX54_008243 [Cotesia glomerata]